MAKIKIRENIFGKTLNREVIWKDLKHIDFQDDDIIDIEYIEPTSEDNGYFYVEVFRMIEETDAEYQERLKTMAETKKMLEKNRYERYLELKKEFENYEKEI